MIGVLDGLSGPLAPRIAAALGEQARMITPRELTSGFDCVVIVLPLRTPVIAAETDAVLAVLSAVSLDRDLVADSRSGIVVVWAALAEDRLALSAPRVKTNSQVVDAWNAAPLLTGRSWAVERRRHPNDATAVRARSAAIRRMIHSSVHRDLRGIPLPDLCTQLDHLDPTHLHCVSVCLNGDRWSGSTGVLAAVHHRRSITTPTANDAAI